jgi:hypothetical protein
MFNPTSTTSVVDTEFVTTSGVTQPAPFQGIVVLPHQTVTAEVGTYVQDQQSIATSVVARSGQIVADELQVVSTGGVQGTALRLGTPGPVRHWVIPRTVDLTNGSSAVSVFNPTAMPEKVRVSTHLQNGSLFPDQAEVGPDTLWQVNTGTSSQIPALVNFSVIAEVVGAGDGIVVDRTVSAPSTSAAPQWGGLVALSSLEQGTPGEHVRSWIVPAPRTAGASPVAGARPFQLVVTNSGDHAVNVAVDRLSSSGPVALGPGSTFSLAPGAFAVIGPEAFAFRSDTLVLRASGPIGAVRDELPAAMPGVVSIEAIPEYRG